MPFDPFIDGLKSVNSTIEPNMESDYIVLYPCLGYSALHIRNIILRTVFTLVIGTARKCPSLEAPYEL